jgi:hypothetical protein
LSIVVGFEKRVARRSRVRSVLRSVRRSVGFGCEGTGFFGAGAGAGVGDEAGGASFTDGAEGIVVVVGGSVESAIVTAHETWDGRGRS